MGKRSYDRITSDAAAAAQTEDAQFNMRALCAKRAAASFNDNKFNLKEYHAADMTCTSTQRVTAEKPGGNEKFYTEVASQLGVSHTPASALAYLADRAVQGKGRCEMAADVGFTIGYQPDSALVAGINPEAKAQLLKLASALSQQDIRRITDECYTPEIENQHIIGNTKVNETQAGLLAGIRTGQQARIDHGKLSQAKEAPSSGLPSLFAPPANAAPVRAGSPRR